MQDKITRIVSSEQMIMQCAREMKQMLSDHGYFNFEIKRGHRSKSQNALYWEWMTEGSAMMNEKYRGTTFKCEVTGADVVWEDIDKDDLHDQMREMFLGFMPPKRVGKSIKKNKLKSTTKLNKGEMFLYMEKIDMLFAQQGLQLSKPEDSAYMQYKEAQQGG
jgi:hypothetical protein